MRPIPQSLHDRAELLARSHPLSTVAMILNVRPNTVSVMKQRGWKACEHDPRLRPLPTDWQIYSRRMTHGQLRRHYRASGVTVTRWFREMRVRPPIKKPGRPRRIKITEDVR